MDFGFFDVLNILGALAFFIFGMKMMSEGIQKAAGGSLKAILGSMTKNKYFGVLSGFLITALVQSSSATTVMTVSFVNAGLLNLVQSAGVMLGANVGTTITSWLVATLGFKVKVAAFSIPLMAFAVPMLFSKRPKTKFLGEFLLGFAILFWGLSELKHAVPDLKNNPEVLYFLKDYANGGLFNNLLFVGVGTLVTIIVQSSSAAMTLTQTLCFTGILPFEIAAAMVLGENIGTTITAEIASIPANVHAKRAARIHSLFNIIGVAWMVILISYFVDLPAIIDWIATSVLGMDPNIVTDNSKTAIAIFHTTFNLLNVAIMIWFVPWLVKTAIKTVKSKGELDEHYKLEYIGGGLLPTSELSFLEAKKEILKFGDITSRMNDFSIELISATEQKKFSKLSNKIRKYEDITDRIEEEIAEYLTKISQNSITEETSEKIRSLHKIIENLERIGDIYYQMSIILERKRNNKIWFTQKQRDNLTHLLELIDKSFKVMIKNLEQEEGNADMDAATEVELEINKFTKQLHKEHILDLENGEYNFKSAMSYRDLFINSKKISDHLFSISEYKQMKI